jgi:Plant protein of unknown function
MAQLSTPNGEILPIEVHIDVEDADIDDVDNLLANSMSNKMHEHLGQPHCEPLTIFKVPEYIRAKHRELYDPQMISIGPYHRGTKSLEPMQKLKWQYLRKLLSDQHEAVACSLSDLVKDVRSLEAEARSAYKESVLLNSNEFVEMMILDGCFIIQYIFLYVHSKANSGISIKNSDLLLLENQIPFFIIEFLHSKFFPYKGVIHLYNRLANFMFGANTAEQLVNPTKCPVHLVDLYYHWLLLKRSHICTISSYSPSKGSEKSAKIGKHSREHQPQQSFNTLPRFFCSCMYQSESPSPLFIRSSAVPGNKLTTTAPIKVIPSATALNEAGVKFKRKTTSRDPFHVTFEKGVMEIPSVILDNTRKRHFSNLIALEQSQAIWEKDLTTFAKLMDMLIDTPKDVAILEKCGILHNLLASVEEATRFFNQICECATVDYNQNYLAELIQDVRQYIDSSWHQNRAMLMRDYFSNPWSIISFVAGILLLIFSCLQVYFAAYPFFKQP